ncbi:hypothetical protein BHE74_00003634 [Ensete ventricosum]|nr:hypothetical protein BHE74_00003634 [Ensete ventricosum]
MTDALSLIPASVLRNLADKLYEKRKNAALEVFWPMPFFRYYACEALYNIAKDIVTDSDQFRCTIWAYLVITYLNHTYDSLLSALSDSSDEVLLRRFFLINALNDKHFI